jgi:hypothetical protein
MIALGSVSMPTGTRPAMSIRPYVRSSGTFLDRVNTQYLSHAYQVGE